MKKRYNPKEEVALEKKLTLNKKTQARLDRENYRQWKKESLKNGGYFIVFNGFHSNGYLKKISGNALKLYLYLGIHSNNVTGESFHGIETISKYFGKNERTIYNWFNELVKLNLIRRSQLEFNGPAHTFIQPYIATVKKIKKVE